LMTQSRIVGDSEAVEKGGSVSTNPGAVYLLEMGH
jgi:hypothetical protein